MYILLSGQQPFAGESSKEILENIKNYKLQA